MKRLYKLTFAFVIVSYWVACAPKNFAKDTEVNKCQNFGEVCTSSAGRDYFEYTKTANGGLVDILFVDDNSGSMSFEQANIANRFSSFLSALDARYIDYRIGVTTTDVSSAATSVTTDDSTSAALYNEARPINQNGALLDGSLVGGTYITAAMSNREQLFKSFIQRPETIQCENFLRQYPTAQPPAAGLHANCPNGDERGIFAANLFVTKNPASFIRPNAHLAIVFLADEDERSGLYLNASNVAYQLESNDQPETLVSNVKSLYSGKSLSVHSIIVRPGDSSCLNQQSNQMGPNGSYGITKNAVLGSYGAKYAQATSLTDGILGDICANDYGSQLATISANIVDRISEITLACENPGNLAVTLAPPQSQITWTVVGNRLQFSEALPAGTQVKLKYSCPTL
jgi:hypothetical protein